MKKSLMTVLAVFAATTMVAQDVQPKEPIQGEVSPSVSALRLASALARYGYEQQNALPLIQAVQIIYENPSQALEADVKGKTDAPTTDNKSGMLSLDVTKLLADAKAFAEGDETLTKLIAQTEANAANTQRGAVNGPRRGVYAVAGNCHNDFDVSFVQGYLAEVAVSGDGDTDLDLYIYDSNGHLIAQDQDYTDDCYVSWVPAWTGRYTVRVVNRGPIYNRYAIVTN